MPVDPLAWMDPLAADRAAKGLSRTLRPHGPSTPGRFERDGRTLLDFGANDYLGLAADPRLAAAGLEAADRHGWGATASPLVRGWTDEHQGLADELAAFERVEAVALFPTGFAANLGTLAALAGPGDAVYCDRLNHACLFDGVKLSGATLRVYPHNDVERLAQIIGRERPRFRRIVIATDGVFSMDGDTAPLADLADLADRVGAILLVDEAHGTGVYGPDGRGACSEHGVCDRVHVRVGTLSKALGSVGGFVAGSRRLIDHLINHARTLIYSTALPPAVVAASRAALAASISEPWRRGHVRALGCRVRTSLGMATDDAPGPIIPVLLGDAGRATRMSARLLDLGFFAPAIRPPTVPRDTARLRISLSAAHTEAEVRSLIEAIIAD